MGTEKEAKENIREAEKILRSLGIEMKVDGCGYHESPWVTFKYKGKTIIDDESNCSLDTKNR